MDIPANNQSNNEEQPRRWSASRIISAVILLLLIIIGISFAVYEFTGNSAKQTTTATTGSSHLASPSPGNNSSKPKSTISHPDNSTNTSKTPAVSSNSNNPKQLSNTGPGDTALIGFMIATLIGYIVHYRWRSQRA